MINNKEQNFISAVIYVHNNSSEISDFLLKINKKLSENFNKYEIICVNDDSIDNSVEEINKVAKQMHETIVTIINMSYYQGLEASMNAGVDLSIGDFVYEFDSIYIDYELDIIINTYFEALKGFDIVSTVSNGKKPLLSKLFYRLFNNNSNIRYQINTETFRILSRRAINRIKSMNQSIPYRKAIYANCGLNITNIEYNPLLNSKSNISKEEIKYRKKLAIDSIILFTNLSYRIAISMSLIMMLSTMVTAIYTVYIFISSKPIAGWTTTMLLLSFAFFGVFTILTIAIKYLSIIVNLIFVKQNYLIKSIEKCK